MRPWVLPQHSKAASEELHWHLTLTIEVTSGSENPVRHHMELSRYGVCVSAT